MTTVKKILAIILTSCAGLLAALLILPRVGEIIDHIRYERTMRVYEKYMEEQIRAHSTPSVQRVSGSCYNLIILDESGSMHGLEEATIAGANGTIASIRSAADSLPDLRQYLTMVTFSARTEGDIVRVRNYMTPIEEVGDLRHGDYMPEGGTPLYDAVGIMLTRMSQSVPGESAVLVTIITDGLENASTRYSAGKLAEVIGGLEDRGWTFTYLGANQDAVLEAGKIGVSNAVTYTADVDGLDRMYRKETMSRLRYYDRVSTAGSGRERKKAGDGYFEDND